MAAMGESVFNPTNPGKEEREIQRFFVEVVEMLFTILFTDGSIDNFPGISQYGSVWGKLRDDGPWFQTLREVLDAYDNGEQPGANRHKLGEDARLKRLSNWIAANQRFYANDTLYKERREELDRVCFMQLDLSREAARARFDEGLSVFKRYERANNYCYPPLSHNKCADSLDHKMMKWVDWQRDSLKMFRNGGGNKFQQLKVQKLNSIGFVWDWKEEYEHLIYQPPSGGNPTQLGPIQKFF